MRFGAFKGIWTRVWALLASASTILAPFTPASAAELMEVRFGAPDKQATRIVFDLSGSVRYAISGNAEGNGSLVIDFEGISAVESSAKGAGHVASYKISPTAGGAQAVLTFSRTAKIKEQFLLEPSGEVRKHRLVVDLVSADKAAFIASLPAPRYGDLTRVLEAVTAPTPAVEARKEYKTIVIDAGHGGADPGASGPGGVQEKTVTLAAAKKLQEILQETGRYHIVMTRANDARLGVEERSKAAREAEADLFISLHADAFGDAAVRGGSIYTLSDEGSKRSAREAQSSDDYHVYSLDLGEFSPDVSSILFDKAQTTTRNASTDFADVLVARLAGVTPMVNNSHRTGDLFVLLSPDVPAVLFELAFISNKADVENLTSPAWREKTMAAVAASIDAYFEGHRETRHASAATQGR